MARQGLEGLYIPQAPAYPTALDQFPFLASSSLLAVAPQASQPIQRSLSALAVCSLQVVMELAFLVEQQVPAQVDQGTAHQRFHRRPLR